MGRVLSKNGPLGANFQAWFFLNTGSALPKYSLHGRTAEPLFV